MSAELPKWHGWATPQYVVEMIIDAAAWLEENDFALVFTTDVPNVKDIILLDKKLSRPDIYASL